VHLVLIMRKESGGIMPIQAMVPAGMSLMLHGLHMLDKSGIAKVAENELDTATKIYTNEMFHKMGVTPQMLSQMGGRVHQIMNDPNAMAAINRKAGVTRSVDVPTPMPSGAQAPPQ
jgi:hypothetical protein